MATMSEDRTWSKHVAVLVFPFASHPSAMHTVVRRISSAAPDVSFSFFSTAESNSSLFPKENILTENIKSYDLDWRTDSLVSSGDPKEPVEHFLRTAEENFSRAMKAAVEGTGRRITCIMTDAFFWFAGDIAEEIGVPWVAVWTGGPHSLLIHLQTDLIRRELAVNFHEDRTLKFLPGLSAIRAVDAPVGVLSGDLNSRFSIMLHQMGLALPRADAITANSFQELDSSAHNVVSSKLRRYLSIGPHMQTASHPSSISDPQGCLDWLRKWNQHSVVYISFGSVTSPTTREIAELAQGIEAAGFAFLWSFRRNLDELPDGFLDRNKERGKFVAWSPQINVLQHEAVAVFVTHGGWNSIMESIVGCVPMICRPFFGDQPVNTRLIEAEWQIGIGLDGGTITRDGIVQALRVVMEKDEGKKMRMNLKNLKDMALKAVQPRGSSSENFRTLVGIITDERKNEEVKLLSLKT